ncbi:cytochrome P450 [Rhexocercosporidium sp. MPI-PUGE-AT-0058]|nr:cytochrome P450 [Rhexocercosporidium sp. MPI-PUGE-AT-0058]
MSLYMSIDSSLFTIAASALVLPIAYLAFTIGYNLFFHPLSGYPGPKLWAMSRIPYNWHTLRGTSAFMFRSMHEKYGDLVRYSPNGLSFTQAEAWDEIYGPYKGKKHMEMDPGVFGGGITVTGAGQITNSINEEHKRLRSRLLRALSAKALASQEEILQHYAHEFVDGLDRELGNKAGVIDLGKWFTMATFDLIGDLAFSKSFQCLKTGTVHPWIHVVFGAFKALPLLRVIREIPGIKLFGKHATFLLPKKIKQTWIDHFNYGADLVDKRFESGEDRPDFAHYLVVPGEAPLTRDEIKENTVQLVTAGSEPTATFNAGMCYYLAKNPDVYGKLKKEIRSNFSSREEMTLTRLASLVYLNLVIREGLRMFPPAADIFPRIIPEGGEVIMGQYLPEGTHVSIGALAISFSAKNFPDPYKFDPERWTDERAARDGKLKASQPFGQGHRSCIGKFLAYAELRLLLASLIFHFDMEMVEDDGDWLEKCRVFIGWEKLPLMFHLTPINALVKKEDIKKDL